MSRLRTNNDDDDDGNVNIAQYKTNFQLFAFEASLQWGKWSQLNSAVLSAILQKIKLEQQSISVDSTVIFVSIWFRSANQQIHYEVFFV